MHSAGEYILSLTASAMLVSILCGLTEEGTARMPVRFLCGLVLLFAVLSPFLDVKIPDLTHWTEHYREKAVTYASAGSEMAETAVADIIKQQTEAYILSVADQFHAELVVEVSLQDHVPVSAMLTGNISPYGKQKLETVLEQDLGITKENILWL